MNNYVIRPRQLMDSLKYKRCRVCRGRRTWTCTFDCQRGTHNKFEPLLSIYNKIKDPIDVYIAAPFFNDKQFSVVVHIEGMLELEGIIFYSPRSMKIDFTKKDSKYLRQKVIDSNIKAIERCRCIVACIDDFDPGTVWEMGVGYMLSKRIVAFSAVGHGLNVMLAQTVNAFTKDLGNIPNLVRSKRNYHYRGEVE